jgi:hypothetical protein
MALTKKQHDFVEYYCRSGNATKAAIQAGYSKKSARFIGAENLSKPNISAAIAERFKETHMQTDEILSRLADMARVDIFDFVDPSGWGFNLDLEAAKKAGLGHLIAEAGFTPSGKPYVKVHDSQSALVHLAKIAGLFRADNETTVRFDLDEDAAIRFDRLLAKLIADRRARDVAGDETGGGD